MLFIHICILNSYVNLCQNLSCQFQTSTIMLTSNFYCHVNFKFLWSHQYQTSTVLSISSSCGHVSQFQFVFAIQFIFVNGQVASSHKEQLVPVNLLLLSVKWLVHIQEQLVPVDLFSFLFSVKRLVQIQGQLVPVLLCLLSAKRLVQIQEQLALPTLFLSSAKRLVRIQEQLVPVYFVGILSQVPSSNQKNNLHLSICCLFP